MTERQIEELERKASAAEDVGREFDAALAYGRAKLAETLSSLLHETGEREIRSCMRDFSFALEYWRRVRKLAAKVMIAAPALVRVKPGGDFEIEASFSCAGGFVASKWKLDVDAEGFMRCTFRDDYGQEIAVIVPARAGVVDELQKHFMLRDHVRNLQVIAKRARAAVDAWKRGDDSDVAPGMGGVMRPLEDSLTIAGL